MLGSPFTPDNIRDLQEVQNAFTSLEKLGRSWIGPDLSPDRVVVVNPGQLIRDLNITVDKASLPPLEINRGILKHLNLSVRSFYAQTGIEIKFHGSKVSDEMLKAINNGEKVAIPIDITNYGQRAVEIDGSVMRFFWVNDKKRLRGQDLVKKIKSGEFAVEGVEGEDWYLGGYSEEDKFTTSSPKADEALCVMVRLKPERFYIPPAEEPVKKDSTKSTREDLANLLRPIPEDANLVFEIGETPKMKFGDNIIGVLNVGWTDGGGKHIQSPLIDPGFNWTIRTETLHGLSEVEFFLYEK